MDATPERKEVIAPAVAAVHGGLLAVARPGILGCLGGCGGVRAQRYALVHSFFYVHRGPSWSKVKAASQIA